MLKPDSGASYNWTANNWGATPSATAGDLCYANSGSKSGWYTILTSGEMANEAFALSLRVSNLAVNGQSIPAVMDIGIDPAGGTSYSVVIPDIIIGNASDINAGWGYRYFFPIYIPAGASVAARGQTSNGSNRAFYIGAEVYGRSPRPWFFPVGSFAEGIGSVSGASGVSFTPGNASDGAWAELGTTQNDLWWLQLGVQREDSTMSASYTWVDLAVGDATNKEIIFRDLDCGTTGEMESTSLHHRVNFFECYNPLPAGSTLYVRGRCNTAPDTGYNARVIGIGGG